MFSKAAVHRKLAAWQTVRMHGITAQREGRKQVEEAAIGEVQSTASHTTNDPFSAARRHTLNSQISTATGDQVVWGTQTRPIIGKKRFTKDRRSQGTRLV